MSASNPANRIPRWSITGMEGMFVKMWDPPTESPNTPDLILPTNPVPEVMAAAGMAAAPSDPHTMELDLLHGIFGIILSVLTWALTVVWWALTLGGLTYWIWYRYLPDQNDNPVVPFVMGSYSVRNDLILHVGAGLFGLVTLPFVLRGLARLKAGRSNEARIAMIAMTTKSSTRVNALRRAT